MDNTELGTNENEDLNEDIYTELHCTGQTNNESRKLKILLFEENNSH